MKNIDYYIQQVKDNKSENISDGGSPAFRFGNIVLVRYSCPLKYCKDHRSRENAEKVAIAVNEKNAKGVRTPKHLAIKREITNEKDVCWVLQQAAPGVSFTKYAKYLYPKTPEERKIQLEMQLKILDAPNSHYEKFVRDLCELGHLGIELKPKNIFYDDNLKNGGFTIIDLLGENGSCKIFDNSLESVADVYNMLHLVDGFTEIRGFDAGVTEEDKDKSIQQDLGIKLKLFLAMEKTISNFEQHRRWILRLMPSNQLEFFEKNGVIVGDLTLTPLEQEKFSQLTDEIVNNAIVDVKNGKFLYWQIKVNEIRNSLNGPLQAAWQYHPENKLDKKDFSNEYGNFYEYKTASEDKLQKILYKKFDKKLGSLTKEAIPGTPLEVAINDLKKSQSEQERS